MPKGKLQTKPRWPHDCDLCRFRGSFFGALDLYTCGEVRNDVQQVVLRYGKEDHEYSSARRTVSKEEVDDLYVLLFWVLEVLGCTFANAFEEA